jgi:CheY-like chemotaxis protein
MKNVPFHILLADDDESDRFLFREALDELEIDAVVNTVNDGVQLMDHLTQPEAPLPNLLFIDLNMPRKNGLECLKEIRANERLKDIPVAIYSTSAFEKDVDETFANGASVYIKKPDDFGALKQVLDKAVVAADKPRNKPLERADYLLRI